MLTTKNFSLDNNGNVCIHIFRNFYVIVELYTMYCPKKKFFNKKAFKIHFCKINILYRINLQVIKLQVNCGNVMLQFAEV
jgi:hypothetical protein